MVGSIGSLHDSLEEVEVMDALRSYTEYHLKEYPERKRGVLKSSSFDDTLSIFRTLLYNYFVSLGAPKKVLHGIWRWRKEVSDKKLLKLIESSSTKKV